MFCLFVGVLLLRPSIEVTDLFSNIGYIYLLEAQSAGSQAVRAREINHAIQWFDRATTIGSSFDRAYRGVAFAYFANGELARAKQEIQRYLSYTPLDDTGKLFLADTLHELGFREQADEMWSGLPAGLLFAYRAIDQLELGNFELAHRYASIAESPAQASASVGLQLTKYYSKLANLALQAGDDFSLSYACEHGRIAFGLMLKGASVQTVSHIDFSKFLRKCNAYPEAIQHLNFALSDKSASESARGWYHSELGLIYSEMGSLAEAVYHLEQAVRVQPSHGGYRVLLASVYSKVGREVEALEQLQIVTDMSVPEWRSWAYGEIGIRHARFARWQLAIQAYENALLVKPEQDIYRVLLAKALIETGQIDDAREELIRASGSQNTAWREAAILELSRLDASLESTP